jgi:RNA polymerase-binding transcription factor DksA
MSTPFTLANLETSEAEIAAVEHAIAALEDGTYATCTECGADLTEHVKVDALASTCSLHAGN